MTKHDRIFVIACCLTGAGILLATLGHEVGILLLVAAALLRPALHKFGLARQYADERQLVIHSRSGNIAFIMMVLAAVGLALWRVARGQSPGELYELIALGLAARAITGLVMGGEYRRAGATILGAVGVFLGVFLGVFIGMEVGLSWGILVAVLLVLMILGIARIALRWPRIIAVILTILVLGVILGFDLYRFEARGITLWLLMVTPLSCAAACLFLGGGSQDRVISGRPRTGVFGSLAAGAALVFSLLVLLGERGNEDTVGGSMATIPEGKVVEIRGVPCCGAIEYYKDGTLEFSHLAREATLSGQLLPAGSDVHSTPEGVFDWCYLPRDTRLQGRLCLGSGHNFRTGFYPNGKLRMAWLVEDEVIDGIPCSKFRFLTAIFHGGSGTYFHKDGRLQTANLSRAFEIQGHSFRKSAIVSLDPDGNLIQKKEQSND